MTRAKWNRKALRDVEKDKELPYKKPFVGPLLKGSAEPYKIERVHAKKRKKKKHPGYTLISPHRLWIFEKGNEGTKNG